MDLDTEVFGSPPPEFLDPNANVGNDNDAYRCRITEEPDSGQPREQCYGAGAALSRAFLAEGKKKIWIGSCSYFLTKQ